jgi:hypothetical protein
MPIAAPNSRSRIGESIAVVSSIGCMLLPTFVGLDALAGNLRPVLVALIGISVVGVFLGAALSKGAIQAVAITCYVIALGAVVLGASLLFGGSGTRIGQSETAVGRAAFWLMVSAWVVGAVFGLCGYIVVRVRRHREGAHAA